VCIAGQPDPASAKIYKYKDEHGKTHFTDDAGKIPLRYRDQGSVKKFRGVAEPTPAPGVPPGFPGQSSGDGGTSDPQAEKEAGLSAKEEGLVIRSIQVFQAGMALGDKYKNVQPSFSNGQGAVNAIQSALPLKENLASMLEGTKVPELQESLKFLKKSIIVDQQTTSIGSGLKTRIAGIFDRLVNEAKEQAALIQKLNQALKESEIKKAEAARKKEEEAKK